MNPFPSATASIKITSEGEWTACCRIGAHGAQVCRRVFYPSLRATFESDDKARISRDNFDGAHRIGVRRLRKKLEEGAKKRTSSAKAQTHFRNLTARVKAVPPQKLSDRKLFQQSKTGQAVYTSFSAGRRADFE